MATQFDLQDWAVPNWTMNFIPGFCAAVMVGLSILNTLIPYFCGQAGAKEIPIKGKHLDKLEFIDQFYIGINKLLIIVFTYHVIYVSYYTPTIKWKWEEATLVNTVGSLVAFYVFYDIWYMAFHRILHIRALYPWVHKHHHRQKAPSRGNIDGINVHPFEFIVGEYLHLVTIYLIPCHILAVAFFIIFGGVLASLNHTRYDIVIPGVYSVKVHDVHHRLPESNYGQYIMLWDYLCGSYRPYDTPIPFNDKDD
eukprot:gene19135-22531_t